MTSLMRRFLSGIAVGFSASAIVASCTPGILTPATGPGTDYPYGIGGHACGGGGWCSEVEDCCPGTPGCPLGSCRFNGAGASPNDDGGARIRPQRFR